MEKIKVFKKSGFIGKGERIRVLDADRLPFYSYNPASGEVYFNLPKGIYFIEAGNVRKAKRPKRYKIPNEGKTPAPRFPIPRKFSISYGNNPHKATINLKKGTIFMDEFFLQLPRYMRVYVFFHEIGHYYYESEEGADRVAQIEMLKRGYNPSQIDQASKATLNDSSRKHYTTGYLKKVK